MGLLSRLFNKGETTKEIQQPKATKAKRHMTPWYKDRCEGSGDSLIGIYKLGYRSVGKCPTCHSLLNATKKGVSWPHKPHTKIKTLP